MKFLNRILLFHLFMTISNFSYSQNWKLIGGFNLSNLYNKEICDSEEEMTKVNSGIHFGLQIESKVSKNICLVSGLIFSSKGHRYFYDGTTFPTFQSEDPNIFFIPNGIPLPVSQRSKLNLYYLDVPINLKSSIRIKKIKVNFQFGPYLGIGLYGNHKSAVTILSVGSFIEEEKIWTNNENQSEIKRIDFGLNLGSGAELGSFELMFDYDVGLNNIVKNMTQEKFYNRVFRISVFYTFRKKE